MPGASVNTAEFLAKFPNELVARNYLELRRWGGRPKCPHCSATTRIQKRTFGGYYRFLSCAVDFTVRTGTIFERSHVSLEKWLCAIYLLSSSDKSISSLRLSREIGATQKTAWGMIQRLREVLNFGFDQRAESGRKQKNNSSEAHLETL